MAGDAPGTENRPGVPSAPPRLALYRRYRPATFAEVRGQEHVTQPLIQAIRNGRVHHAYLFSGPRGCGKTSSARILARSLNCVRGPTPDPCGVCESCVALAPSGPGSIDVIEIDAASHGGVDDARDLRERAFYAPVSGRFRVYIVDEAHMVTSGGFNALLKLVEEPPPHLKFVFATTEPEKVIPTIRSRTHHYPFRLVPPSVLRGLLEEILAAEAVPYQPAVLPLVVRAGAGSVRDSLSVLDQLVAGAGNEGLTYERTVALLGYTDDSLLDEMVDALAAGDGAATFGTVDRVVQGGHDPRRFAADLLDRLRDLIILGAVPGAGRTGLLDAPADRLEQMAGQAGRFGQAGLARSAAILSDGLVQMRGTTAPRLLLELMCAQILLPGASTGDEKAFLTRLERLEQRLGGQPLVTEGASAEAPRRGTGGEARRATAPEAPGPEAAAGTAAEAGRATASTSGPPPERRAAERAAPGREVQPASGRAERAAPVREERPASGRAERAAPGRAEQPASGREERPASGREESAAPVREEQPASGRAESAAPGREEQPAPVREQPAPGRVERAAPQPVEQPASGRAERAAPQPVEEPAPEREERPAPPREERAPAAAETVAAPEQRAAQAPAASARPAAAARAGAVDTDTVRERWQDVLDAVRRERKVAWMLLAPAAVESLDGGVLTIAFPREGEARGFASSGHDQVLTRVLGTMLGLNVRVRGIVASGAAPGAPRSAKTAPSGGEGPARGAAGPGAGPGGGAATQAAGPGGGSARGAATLGGGPGGGPEGGAATHAAEPGGGADGGAAAQPGGPRGGAARGAAQAAGPGGGAEGGAATQGGGPGGAGAAEDQNGAGGGDPAENPGRPRGEHPADDPGDGPAARSRAAPPPRTAGDPPLGAENPEGGGAIAARPAEAPVHATGGTPKRGSRAVAAGAARAGNTVGGPPPEEEWPDDSGPAAGDPGPTGVELIERHLGGRIIEEIDES